jgi:hypothetical protein
MVDFDIKLCMDNGERLARIEAIVSRIENRKPCMDCQNVGSIITMKQNLKIINWFAIVLGGAGLVQLSRWILNMVASHGDKIPPLG